MEIDWSDVSKHLEGARIKRVRTEAPLRPTGDHKRVSLRLTHGRTLLFDASHRLFGVHMSIASMPANMEERPKPPAASVGRRIVVANLMFDRTDSPYGFLLDLDNNVTVCVSAVTGARLTFD